MQDLLLDINLWMASASWMAFVGCLLWGLVSVLMSPCHLASIPLIVGYVGGQDTPVSERQGALLAVIFSLCLFASIALIGLVGLMLGTLLGDISPVWGLLPGGLLIGLAWQMTRANSCARRLPRQFGKMHLRGKSGAWIIGMSFGLVSGLCTFGFLAPIFVVFADQQQWMFGIAMLLLFAVGHCIPIAMAGSSAALVQRLLNNQAWQCAAAWVRRFAQMMIGATGLYFIAIALTG